MKKFLIRISLFLIPVFIVGGILEYLLRGIENQYTIKKNHLSEHAEDIEALFLGNSHNYHALNPDFINLNAYNASHNGQPLEIDYLILEKYQNQLKNLKWIGINISYFSPFYTIEDVKQVQKYYVYSELKESYNPVLNSILLSLRLKINLDRITNYYLQDKNNLDEVKMKKNGHLVLSPFEGNLYKECKARVVQQSYDLNSDEALEKFKENFEYLQMMIEKAQQLNCKLFFYTTPHHPCFVNQINQKQFDLIKSSIKELLKDYPNEVFYSDFIDDASFIESDFHDPDHLNAEGAEKFSKMINYILKK